MESIILHKLRFLCFSNFRFLTWPILGARQLFLMLQTLKLNNKKRKKINVLRRKKFGRIDSWLQFFFCLSHILVEKKIWTSCQPTFIFIVIDSLINVNNMETTTAWQVFTAILRNLFFFFFDEKKVVDLWEKILGWVGFMYTPFIIT